jgi:hypothetical protein
MAVTADDIRTHAQAFLDALTGMTAKQREQTPTSQYCEQFNKLLGLAKVAAPDVDKRMWPEEVTPPDPTGFNMMVSSPRYVEIETYIRQIIGLLPPASYA